MLPKSQRLNLRKSFTWVVSSGRRFETQNFRFKLRLGENEKALVGISLSSKEFKKAHERNRARRLTSKAIQEIYQNLPNNLNLVIMPKASILLVGSQELVKELKDVKDFNFSN